MKSLKIKSIKAHNFLSFGEDGIEVGFEDLGKIVLIKGKNLDYEGDSKSKSSSNGSGKSSIQEIICYALYGKTIKSPKKINKNDVINNFTKKNCCVEIYFDDYKISRGRSPDFLRLWKSSESVWDKNSEITQGKQQDTQAKIDSIIGINYDVFVSTCVFSDDQNNCFLEADLSNKRSIIENLLSLDVYRDRFESSKDLLRDSKNSLKQFVSEYEILDSNKNNLDKRLQSTKQQESSWKNSKKLEMTKLMSEIKSRKNDLSLINEDKDLKIYKEAKTKMSEIDKEIDTNNTEIENLQNSFKEYQDKKVKFKESLDLKNNKKIELEKSIKNCVNCFDANLKEISKYKKNSSGQKCEHCLSIIDPENFKEIIKNLEETNIKLKKEINEFEKSLKSIKTNADEESIKDVNSKLDDIQKNISKRNLTFKNLRDEYKQLSLIKEPDSNTRKSVLEKEIEVLKSKLKDLKLEYEGDSPYVQVISTIEEDIKDFELKLEEKKSKTQDLEKDIPYINFWVDAFGDAGIRKWVVDGIVPLLNKKLQYWMFVLDNNRLNIEFNNELQERIYKKIGDEEVEFAYHVLSAGQKRRINLAVSQSFAHIMLSSVCSCPSVVFLDEVTTNIDPVGVLGIYNLICELSEDRQVFITTHDNDLLDLLDGCDTINLEMKNGISNLKIKNKEPQTI